MFFPIALHLFLRRSLLTELKLVYLGGMTVGSPRNPPSLLPGVGIEHVMG